MSDFLKNLRSSHKNDPSDPKRNLDGHFYPKNDRRKVHDRRNIPSSDTLDYLVEELIQLLPKIADNSSVLSSLLEILETKSELLIDAKIRELEAISTFFENLNTLVQSDPSVSSGKAVKVSTSYASGTHYTKDEILNTMKTLRKKGATFAQIADYLTRKGIPTFSGKGEWHAQTVHRLCK